MNVHQLWLDSRHFVMEVCQMILSSLHKVAGVTIIPIALVKAIVSETSVVRHALIPALLGLAVLCCLLGLLPRHHRRHRHGWLMVTCPYKSRGWLFLSPSTPCPQHSHPQLFKGKEFCGICWNLKHASNTLDMKGPINNDICHPLVWLLYMTVWKQCRQN